MIRELLAKIGRRKGKSGQLLDIKSPEESAVPFRNRRPPDFDASPESAIVTKKDHVDRFNEAINHLVNKLEGIHEHLGKQVNQTEQLIEKMGQLPDLLKTMPQSVDRQEQSLRSLLDHLQAKNIQDRQMMDLLATLPGETSRQSQQLGEIHQQLSESAKTDRQMSEHIGHCSDSLSRLNQETVSQTEWIQRMNRTFQVTDRYLKLTVAKQQRRFLWLTAICIGISILSVGGLVAGIILLNRG